MGESICTFLHPHQHCVFLKIILGEGFSFQCYRKKSIYDGGVGRLDEPSSEYTVEKGCQCLRPELPPDAILMSVAHAVWVLGPASVCIAHVALLPLKVLWVPMASAATFPWASLPLGSVLGFITSLVPEVMFMSTAHAMAERCVNVCGMH